MELEVKRFTKNDDSFICAHCGKEVKPLGYSSRNHCPFCLWSLHVDKNPGDRAEECRGELRPVKVLPDAKKGYIIVHKCEKCGALIHLHCHELEAIERHIFAQHGFKLDSMKTVFYGVCEQCS